MKATVGSGAISPRIRARRDCMSNSLPVFEVRVTEDKGGDHWSWWDNKDGEFCFHQPSQVWCDDLLSLRHRRIRRTR